MRYILGLDVSSKVGWALWDAQKDKLVESGVQDFTKKRGESSGLMFLKFRRWLCEEFVRLCGLDIALIAYEAPHHKGGAATHICVNMAGIIEAQCELMCIEPAPVHSGTLKKFAAGHGKASKEDMVEAAKPYHLACYGEEPLQPLTHDEADAIHVARWAAKEYA